MLALSPTVTLNVFEYIRKLLKLYLPIQLYKKLLDYPNLIYIIAKIRKPKFEELVFIISSTAAVTCISKTIILIDNIDITGKIAKNL